MFQGMTSSGEAPGRADLRDAPGRADRAERGGAQGDAGEGGERPPKTGLRTALGLPLSPAIRDSPVSSLASGVRHSPTPLASGLLLQATKTRRVSSFRSRSGGLQLRLRHAAGALARNPKSQRHQRQGS